MPMLVLFLNPDGTYKAADPGNLSLRQMEPGITALGVVEPKQKFAEDGKTPLLDKDGKPEFAGVFLPIITYPVNMVPVAPKPAIEVATKIPDGIPAPTKKVRQKKSVN